MNRSGLSPCKSVKILLKSIVLPCPYRQSEVHLGGEEYCPLPQSGKEVPAFEFIASMVLQCTAPYFSDLINKLLNKRKHQR